ncbi:MAG: hypothetical protein CM1200mP14_27130 [Gammaproteobacteria bacterium]|nr:MAG: hypothetical protein CM1200mP14_27130 [Gammaproteobacteria bacterium]
MALSGMHDKKCLKGAVYDFGLFSGGSSTESVQENWSTLLGVTPGQTV